MEKFTEFSLIEYIKAQFADLSQDDILTIGDDCAVLPYSATENLVVTTDMLVEGVHFLRDKISPFELGRKAVNVNLSDVASMGARPLGITLSIALDKSMQDAYLMEFTKGVRSCNTLLLGGDTTSSKDTFTISVTAIGVVEKQNLKLRNAAKVDDIIYVTANLGDSAAGLYGILNNLNVPKELLDAHNNPTAHLSSGLKLGANPNVNAMMDISDGIASDLQHILKASNVSAIIETTKTPLSNTLINFCNANKVNPLHFALEGGEDYCLLFTASKDAQFDFTVYPIGTITAGNKCTITWLPDGNFTGFTHF